MLKGVRGGLRWYFKPQALKRSVWRLHFACVYVCPPHEAHPFRKDKVTLCGARTHQKERIGGCCSAIVGSGVIVEASQIDIA